VAPAAVVPATEAPATQSSATPEDKRIFGVLPNYRTAEASIPFAPLSTRQKMTIAYKDSFDWPDVKRHLQKKHDNVEAASVR
jgi:hypothetical protein